jgi:hypothetical protein
MPCGVVLKLARYRFQLILRDSPTESALAQPAALLYCVLGAVRPAPLRQGRRSVLVSPSKPAGTGRPSAFATALWNWG